MRVTVADHPLITHKLTVLRDKNTPSPVFRQLVEELVTLLAYGATRGDDLTGRQVYIIDPMLATGGTLIDSIDYVFERGATEVTCVCLLGAPEGLAAVEAHIESKAEIKGKNVAIVLGALDEKLNEHGYIVPGLGDAGDRLYGIAQ